MPPLRRLRRLKGWSLRDLAREAGVAVDTVLDLEHRARLPRPSTMRRIAAALGVQIGDVDEFREEGEPAAPDRPGAGPH
jgi:transcriptional regulator with XRE-family HTH domain